MKALIQNNKELDGDDFYKTFSYFEDINKGEY